MHEQVKLYRVSFPLFRRHYTHEVDAMKSELGFEAGMRSPQGVSHWSCARTVPAALDLIDRTIAIFERFSEGAPLTYMIDTPQTNLWSGKEQLNIRWTMNTKWRLNGPLLREVEPMLDGCTVSFFRPLRYDCPFLGSGVCEERWQVSVLPDWLNLWST